MDTPRKMLLIMNPGSRSGRGRRLWSVWRAGLRRAGILFETVETTRIGHACEAARGADGFDVVVAAGGDGTINEVLDGVVQSGKPELRMGVLYSGTSPDFCRFHAIPADPDSALRVLLDGKCRKVDVARITYCDEAGRERVAHFGCSCNIGMGASVARHSNRRRWFLGDALGTAAAVVKTLLRHRRADLELEIDGENHHLAGVNNLTIAKNPYLASGLKLRLEARPDDGRLWLVGVCGRGRLAMCATVPRYYTGSVVAMRGVFLTPCHSVTVQSQTRQEIEFDGDPRGFLPARVEILPGRLLLIGDEHERV